MSRGLKTELDNAELMRRAIEQHYVMVDALQQARLQIEYLHEKFGETGSGNNVLQRINQALRFGEPEATPSENAKSL